MKTILKTVGIVLAVVSILSSIAFVVFYFKDIRRFVYVRYLRIVAGLRRFFSLPRSRSKEKV